MAYKIGSEKIVAVFRERDIIFDVFMINQITLQKHAYSIIVKISLPNTEIFQTKILIFSYFSSKQRLWILVRTASRRF